MSGSALPCWSYLVCIRNQTPLIPKIVTRRRSGDSVSRCHAAAADDRGLARFAVGVLQHHPKAVLGGRESRGDRALWDAQRLGDRPVRVTVVMAQHDRRRLLGRQLRKRLGEVSPLDVVLRIRAESWTPDAPDHLAHLAEPHLPL